MYSKRVAKAFLNSNYFVLSCIAMDLQRPKGSYIWHPICTLKGFWPNTPSMTGVLDWIGIESFVIFGTFWCVYVWCQSLHAFSHMLTFHNSYYIIDGMIFTTWQRLLYAAISPNKSNFLMQESSNKWDLGDKVPN